MLKGSIFFISINAEEFRRRPEKIGSPENCHWSSNAVRANFSSADHAMISGDLGFNFQDSFHCASDKGKGEIDGNYYGELPEGKELEA